MIELVRRIFLAGGVAMFLWLLLDTRPFLYSVIAVDFEKDYAMAVAASRVSPYAMTPGMDSTSAQQRPSSSRPKMIGIDSTMTVSINAPGFIIVLARFFQTPSRQTRNLAS